MSVSYTMGSTKPLIIVILLSIYIQNIQCKDFGDEIKPVNDLLNKPYAIATRDRDLRGVLEQIKNTAEQIKKRALASWNYMKKVAESTRGDILKWVNSARQYGIKLEKALGNELLAWWLTLKTIILTIIGIEEDLTHCLIDETANTLHNITDIVNEAATCITMELRNLQPIQGKQEKIIVNDTLFIADLDRKLDACKADMENYVECLNTVSDLVSEDIEEKRNEIQNTGIELRDLADTMRASLLDCVEQAVMDLGSFILNELQSILNCVKNIE